MAKNNRFPSDANKTKAAPKVDAAPEKTVEGKAVPLVKIQYKLKNHHVISPVHALREGDNTIPVAIWEEAKKHPSIVKMIADGHIVEPKAAKGKKAQKDDAPPADDESEGEGKEKDGAEGEGSDAEEPAMS